jgi:murein DD-endopeptidase MepM/ murein hydrolase activator NlpD
MFALGSSDESPVETINALKVPYRSRSRLGAVAFLVMVITMIPLPAHASISYGEMVDYDLVFPVDGDHYFSDTFGASRSHGKGHQGQDIMAAKGTPVVAAASGTIRYVNWTARSHLNPDRCCSVVVKHDDGWETRYLHLNNDTPGTDNGKAWGIADGIVPGAPVEAGQLLGWVGDSGNAEKTPPHLHFELIDPDGVHANSFESLLAAGGNPPAREWSAGEDPLFASSELLRRGDKGDAVERLQEILDGLGYEVGPIDGIFGPVTADAVLQFQRDQGLAVDGLVGSQTRDAAVGLVAGVTDVLGLGSRGPEVREAQQLLAALGFNPGPSDGVFGPRTLDAVLDFQRSLGLQVDGLVGPQTRSRLGVR